MTTTADQMDTNADLFSILARSVREMNIRRTRVIEAGNDANSVAYHAAELVQHAAAADQAMKMVSHVVRVAGESELYDQAWSAAIEGETDQVYRIFVRDAISRA